MYYMLCKATCNNPQYKQTVQFLWLEGAHFLGAGLRGKGENCFLAHIDRYMITDQIFCLQQILQELNCPWLFPLT
jgi:hypothetical protein